MIGTNNIYNTAIKAINNEGKAILALKKFINLNFFNTIAAIVNCKGRIVISGVGKSAIVAQKIVATFNSTGTPALYMHAADAIHGDLGMVQDSDIVIIISKSGETSELKTVVPLIKTFGNKIIGIVGNENSFLAQHCDIFINTTIAEEACPNNLAPTTSTTAQIVMGDAIAICLMEANNFKSENFAKYHPGGTLGKKLFLRVADLYFSNNKPLVNINTKFKDVLFEISKKRLGATVVEDENKNVVGIITDGDVRRSFEKYEDIKNINALMMMTENIKTIDPNALAVDALQVMKQNDITQLVVTSQNNYLGILHLHDVLKEGVL